MAVAQKGEFRAIHDFFYPCKLQALEINSHIEVSLGLLPRRHTETLADAHKLQEINDL